MPYKFDPESLESLTHSFIHSFSQAISIAPLQVRYYSEALPIYSTDTVSEFHVEAPSQATANEGLVQGPYVAVERDSNPRPFERKVTNLPKSHRVIHNSSTF